jgi:hypothetical protein
MQALISRFVRRESGVTAYGLIAAALMLIGVGAWVVATAPRVVASPQIGIDPLQMMGNAGNLPTAESSLRSFALPLATNQGPGFLLRLSPWLAQRKIAKRRLQRDQYKLRPGNWRTCASLGLSSRLPLLRDDDELPFAPKPLGQGDE